MFKKWLVVVAVAAFALTLNGCATSKKKQANELESCKNQVSMLESQVQNRDEEINMLRYELNKMQEKSGSDISSAARKKVIPEVKSRPTCKQIQTALKNAGYNPGAIDGKMGRATTEAIKAFQRDNKLRVDGKVGKRTWNLLRTYLYQKVK